MARSFRLSIEYMVGEALAGALARITAGVATRAEACIELRATAESIVRRERSGAKWDRWRCP